MACFYNTEMLDFFVHVTNLTKTIIVIHLCFTSFNASKEPHLLSSLFMNLIDVLNWVIFCAVLR